MIPKFEFDLLDHIGETLSDVTISLINAMVEHYNEYIVGKHNGK